MCEQCKQQRINQEFESVLHPEYESAFNQEMEWSNYFSKIKNFTSPFFNWIGGSSSKPSAGYAKPSVKNPKTTGNYQQPLTETQLVKNAIAAGDRNENSLTDKVFFKRHPELGGKPLYTSQPNFSALSSEWLSIRNNIVRPALQSPSASPIGSSPAPGYSGGGGTGKTSLQSILNALAKKSYVIYSKPYQLNIVGVRAPYTQSNSFDDSINVFYKDSFGNWQFKSNSATTDPGTFYLNKPIHDSGTAIVVPGQYINSHQIGLHRSSYTALVQRGPLKIILDANRDNILDFDSRNVITGSSFGINIHKAGTDSTDSKVDNFSAGCQVFARTADFDAFISLCQQHSQLYGNNFTYTLLEEKDLK
jgi:hypothetical protein